MLLVFNATYNIQFTFLPIFKYQRDKNIWYLECKWLGIQTTLYSKQLGNNITKILNQKSKQGCQGCIHDLDDVEDFDYTCYGCKRFHEDEYKTGEKNGS